MIFRALHRMGLPSDVFYAASFASIAASILAWRIRSEKDVPHAERLGIFIGLWGPTFMLMGQGIQQLETVRGMGSATLEGATQKAEQEVAGTATR